LPDAAEETAFTIVGLVLGLGIGQHVIFSLLNTTLLRLAVQRRGKTDGDLDGSIAKPDATEWL